MHLTEIKLLLTQIRPMFHFYTPWKRRKTQGFLTVSGGIEMEQHCTNMVN